MTKYRLQGLDCANCANDIELALKRVEGFSRVQVNFATLSVALDPSLEAQARTIIAEVDPAVKLVSAEASPADVPEAQPRAHLVRLAFTVVLAGAGFFLPGWASVVAFLAAYALVGYPVLWSAGHSLFRGKVFNEMFLMSVATLGAVVLGQYPEAVGVMLFYSVGEYFQNRAVARSRRSISALMNLRPESVRVLEDGVADVRKPELVNVGDLVEVFPGERIPVDAEVVEGTSSVDTSTLTGEPLPRTVTVGDPVLSGFVNDEGRLLLRVTKPFGQSSAARILALVEDASANKAPTEKFITRFAARYTPAVVVAAALVALLPPLLLPGATFEEWGYRALVLLVISCPCALVLSIPLGYFGGLGAATRLQVLLKGGHVLDALTKVDTVVFDKTGTLTTGDFVVGQVIPSAGFTGEQVLAWAAAAESRSSHPIARCLRGATGSLPTLDQLTEVKGYGVLATIGGRTVVVGSDRLLRREGLPVPDTDTEFSLVHVAVDGQYAGSIEVTDQLKPEAPLLVAELRRLGVRRLVLVTGDKPSAGERVARALGLDEVFTQQLPEDKVATLERLMASAPLGKKTVFVGDGMNDAPVLMRADVGVAMGGLGSDAAMEAADAVLMDDHLLRLPQALRLAAFTRQVVWQNIGFALAVKAAFLVLGAFGFATMWEAVIADVGVSLIAVFNAIRTLRYTASSPATVSGSAAVSA